MNPPAAWDETNFMYTIKLICLTIVNLVKQVWLLPQTVTLALRAKAAAARAATVRSRTARPDTQPVEVCGKVSEAHADLRGYLWDWCLGPSPGFSALRPTDDLPERSAARANPLFKAPS